MLLGFNISFFLFLIFCSNSDFTFTPENLWTATLDSKDQLYRSYQVYSDTAVVIRSLDKGKNYWFAIDAFGENGVTSGEAQGSIIDKK